MTVQRDIVFSIKSLSKKEIFGFLKKNENDHYQKLSDLVDLEDYAQKLSEKALHFTLYDQDTLIGFSGCYFNDETSKVGYISGISILDAYRGIGLGGQLLKHIVVYGKENGFRVVNITPDCNNNGLISFLEKYGFIVTETVANNRCLIQYTIAENCQSQPKGK